MRYNGEENTRQANIQITNINGMAISANAASEAFDEGLSKEAVVAIVKPFIKALSYSTYNKFKSSAGLTRDLTKAGPLIIMSGYEI
jgi:hypothetical protein